MNRKNVNKNEWMMIDFENWNPSVWMNFIWILQLHSLSRKEGFLIKEYRIT